MIQQKITITDDGRIIMPSHVFMKPSEIAELFGVYVQTIHSNIRSVLKSRVIRPDISQGMVMTGNLIIPEAYGLDMITALAFRIHSPNAEKFRIWVIINLGATYSSGLHVYIDSPIGLN
jgi:hypothetical protein